MRLPMVIIHSQFCAEQETLSLLKVHLICSSAMQRWKFCVLIKKNLFESSKYPYLRETPRSEMHALIRFMYLCGLHGLNHYKIPVIFSEKFGPPIFGAIFSREQVKSLMVCPSFIGRESYMENCPSEQFASCRPVFELFNAKCLKYLAPSPYLNIGETLFPMHQQILFRQFNLNELHNYGLYLKSLNDANLPYTFKSAPYAGNPPNRDGSYYIESTEKCVKYLGECY